MDLKSKLNTAKNIASETPVSERRITKQSVSAFVGNVDDLTEQVFGNKMLDDGSGKMPYDPKAEMKMIQNGIPQDKLANSKLPAAIKEAIASNPLIVTSSDPKMDAFTAKLAAVQGVQKAANIMNQLDEEDKEKENARKAALNENIQRGVNIDYGLIKSIVENAVKSLKDEIKNELNESISHNSQHNDTSLKVMKMANKFLFLDSEDNIYECQMIYKGKNKTKKQQ